MGVYRKERGGGQKISRIRRSEGVWGSAGSGGGRHPAPGGGVFLTPPAKDQTIRRSEGGVRRRAARDVRSEG